MLQENMYALKHAFFAVPYRNFHGSSTKLKSCPESTKRLCGFKMNSKRVQHWDRVYHKVKSKKSSLSLGRCSKLAPRYCGPFEMFAKIGPVAYHLALPPNIKVHDVLHVSLLKNIYICMMLLI